MSAEKDRVNVGEYISLKSRITNVGGENHTYNISPPAFDVLLFYGNGTLWARWSEGQNFPEVTLNQTLAPGQFYEEEIFWNFYRFDSATYTLKPPSPGTYYLEGVFRSLPDLQSQKITLIISLS